MDDEALDKYLEAPRYIRPMDYRSTQNGNANKFERNVRHEDYEMTANEVGYDIMGPEEAQW